MRFYDADASWDTFVVLEGFADGMGAWRVQDVLGRPVMDLPWTLVEDLLTWRDLASRVRRMNEKQRGSPDET